MKRLLPIALLAVACTGPDTAPTIIIRSPANESIAAGVATISALFSVEDDSNDTVEVEFSIDEGEPVVVTGEDCARGCAITTAIPTEELAEDLHTMTARVTDFGGQSTDAEPVEFSIFDIPYVRSLAVLDSQESGLNGPGLEVEVHLLDDETAQWLGCAPMTEVQQDGVLYEDLAVPFLANEAGDLLLYKDISFNVVRVVVIESDNNEHCPVWPALTPELKSDVDDLYGISPPVDLSLLFSGTVEPSVLNTTGLSIGKGRPIGAL